MDRTIRYQWLPNGVEEYDGVVTASVDNVAKWFDFDLSEAMDGVFRDYIDNPVYSSVRISFNEDTREIVKLILICQSGITESEIREWFDDHYKPYTLQDTDCYISGKTYARSEYYVVVSTDPSTGKVFVAYLKNSKM